MNWLRALVSKKPNFVKLNRTSRLPCRKSESTMKTGVARTAFASSTKPAGRKPLARPTLQELPTFQSVEILVDSLRFTLSDDRVVEIPLAWSTRLTQATEAQRRQFVLSAYNVFWDEVDEIIGVENLLYGREQLWL